MDLNKKLEELKPYQLNCNVFDVYSYNGLTMQDLLCQFFTKINECIHTSNETIDLAKWLVNEGLEIEVVKKLMIWLEDGTLENIINVNLFNTLNEKINGLSSELEHITNGTVIIKTNGVDDSDVIQRSLNDGYNVILKGDIHTSKKIVVSNPNQSIIQDYGTWYVHHVNDNAIHVLSYNNKIKCNFSGAKQIPGNYNISCVVVGQGGTEAAEKGRSCDLSHTQIKHYQGNAIRWINGARINLFYTEIFACNGHGLFTDIGCKDNNDGNFDNLSIVNCGRYGVYLKKYSADQVQSDVVSDNIGSMQSGNNVFRNTKCFGNKTNFVIETNLNTGTIFSEDNTGDYDLFSGSRNTIKYLGDITTSNNFRNTGNNEIEFQDSFHNTNRNNLRTKKLTISDTYSATNEIYQEGNNVFVDTITDTYNEVVVRHEKGSASSRTDEFHKIKIGDCPMRLLTQKKIQLEGQVVNAGSYLKIDYGESIAVPFNAIIKHFVVLNQENDLIVTAFNRRLDSGWYRPYIMIYNPTGSNITLRSGSTIDYTAFY